MTLCEHCDGNGFNLWMDRSRPKFLPCLVCATMGTIMWLYGAAPCPPWASNIRVRADPR